MKKLILVLFNFCIVLNCFSVQIVSENKILLGIDELEKTNFQVIDGKRIGLITNSTGINSKLRSTIDILYEAPNVKLVALFAPEHGIRGIHEAGNYINSSKDNKTGLPIYSLYGKNKKPNSQQLINIDALVFDIQDIGCRSYTYISTMGECMKAASKAKIPIYILDRPNPLGGLKIEGSGVDDDCISFVSSFDIPYIYGLTIGELALYLNNEVDIYKDCELHVIQMKNWKRKMLWKDTGLAWIPTSPHIPNASTCAYYPMTGILGELYSVNIGVGYTLPFQLIAAPWIDANNFADHLNALKLAGLYFRPISYKPYYSTYKNILCNGVSIIITDYDSAYLTDISFYVIQVLNELYPKHLIINASNKNRFKMFDKVCGSSFYRLQILKGKTWNTLRKEWSKDEKAWYKITQKYYLYQ